jgi:hypothetical protein
MGIPSAKHISEIEQKFRDVAYIIDDLFGIFCQNIDRAGRYFLGGRSEWHSYRPE